MQEGAEAVDTHGGERPGQLSAGDRVSQRESVITEVPTVEVLLQERDELMRQLVRFLRVCSACPLTPSSERYVALQP